MQILSRDSSRWKGTIRRRSLIRILIAKKKKTAPPMWLLVNSITHETKILDFSKRQKFY